MVATTFLTSFITLALSTTLVAASPFPHALEPLPRDASHLAFDKRSNTIIAFRRDGTNLGAFNATLNAPGKRADSSSCSNLSADDAQKLPGWSKLNEKADSNWGKGSRNIVTNPDEYKDQPAQICADTKTIAVTSDDKQTCSESTQTTEGKLVGSGGSVLLTKTTGSLYSTENTVTKTTSVAVGQKFGAKITIDKVLEIGEEVSIDTTFTNTLSSSEKSENNQQQTSTQSITAPEGKKCHLSLKQKSCTVEGKGRARFIADGFVWFNYNDKTQGHYKWALPLSTVSEDERSMFMEFRSAVSSVAKTDYEGKCE